MADPDEDLQNQHYGHAAMAYELSQPAADLPAGVPGNEGFGEYLPPQQPQPQERQPQPRQPQQRTEAQPQPRQQQGHYQELADPEDDPVLHMQQRFENTEAYLHQAHHADQQRELWNHVLKTEDDMRKETEEDDYDDAAAHLINLRTQQLTLQYPDTHEVAAIARQHGHASPAHLRQAILHQEAVDAAQHAVRNGMTPAQLYYAAALQLGYKPRTVATKSHMRQVLKAIDTVGDKDFDDWWAQYKRASEQVEANHRGRD